MGTEFELKFLAEESVFDMLKQETEHWTSFQMETTYYDTVDAALSNLRWTLRRRFENGVSVCALKTPAGGQARNEFEVECQDIAQAVPMMCQLGAPTQLMSYTNSGIVEVCGARFHRWAGQVCLGDTQVELALDKGVLLGAGQEQPFVEVEVELKSGDPQTAIAYANSLAQRFALRPESRSKYKRALILAGKA